MIPTASVWVAKGLLCTLLGIGAPGGRTTFSTPPARFVDSSDRARHFPRSSASGVAVA
ncbi:hypothetical protein [Nocardia sp. NPDC047038]|uniref:hypothetical protein n=1 Tax=Nocardia TaxID=1817 RepID=UPI0033E3FB26